MTELEFAKGEALGNDYIVLDRAVLPSPMTGARARSLCDRHRGIGGDGVLVGDLAASPIGCRIFNPDGSEAEKSGNGLRIFAAWLYDRGDVGREPFEVALATDRVELHVQGAGDEGVVDVAAAMGRATFGGGTVAGPDSGAASRADAGSAAGAARELRTDDGAAVTVYPVSLGNPHAVVIEDSLREERLRRLGPWLEHHAVFANGANVQLARVTGPADAEAWIHERGVGETLASGSSACAVAAVVRSLGLVEESSVRVTMKGGAVVVDVSDEFGLRLFGPARIVFTGLWREQEAGSRI